MIRTIEAIIDATGRIQLKEPIVVPGVRRAFITILEEPPLEEPEIALLSEPSLSVDWLKPEEDEAWSHLQ